MVIYLILYVYDIKTYLLLLASLLMKSISLFLLIIDPFTRPDIPKLTIHSQMEVKLNIL
jgi:hypothetical protein